MPVVRCKWVEDCQKTCQRLPFGNYMLPPLSGCILSFTNMQKKLREKLKDKIVALGGNVAADMSKSCTYLVVGDVHPVSQKLKYVPAHVWPCSPAYRAIWLWRCFGACVSSKQ